MPLNVKFDNIAEAVAAIRQRSLDHFIPWSRYPVDLGHNFVLADDGCNGAKGSMLAAEEHLERWTERNVEYGEEIRERCVVANVRADLDASMQIARWAYGQATAVGAMLWVSAETTEHARQSCVVRLP